LVFELSDESSHMWNVSSKHSIVQMEVKQEKPKETSTEKPYPTWPLPRISFDKFASFPQSGIFQASWFTGIIDEYGEKHYRSFQKEL